MDTKTGIRINSFWAITTVVVVAAILGGIIYFYGQNNEYLDNVYSISFNSPVQIHKTAKSHQKPGAATTTLTTDGTTAK